MHVFFLFVINDLSSVHISSDQILNSYIIIATN